MSNNTQTQGRTEFTEATDVAAALPTIAGEDDTRRLRRYEIALQRALTVGNPVLDPAAKEAALARTNASIAVPTITGTATVGSTLTAVPGAVTGTPTPTVTYQWYVNGTAVPNATNPTFVAQVGADTVRTTATNANSTAAATSAATTIPATVPTIATPTVTGTATVGSTLTAVLGAVTGAPTPTVTYQWKIGGTAIAGATNATFVAQAGTVTVTATATNSAGTAAATSAGTTVP